MQHSFNSPSSVVLGTALVWNERWSLQLAIIFTMVLSFEEKAVWGSPLFCSSTGREAADRSCPKERDPRPPGSAGKRSTDRTPKGPLVKKILLGRYELKILQNPSISSIITMFIAVHVVCVLVVCVSISSTPCASHVVTTCGFSEFLTIPKLMHVFNNVIILLVRRRDRLQRSSRSGGSDRPGSGRAPSNCDSKISTCISVGKDPVE
jgi:hypothetical protein